MSVRVYVAYTHTLIRHRSLTDQTKHAVAHRGRIYVSASVRSLCTHVDTTQISDRPNQASPWLTEVVSMSVRVYVAYAHTLIRHRSLTDQTKHAVAHRGRIYVSASVRSLYTHVDTTQISDRPNQARRGSQRSYLYQCECT